MTTNDLNFLSKALKINKAKTKVLCEEEGDLDLVIDSLTSKPFSKEKLSGISFSLYAKIVIFQNTKNENVSLREKSLIARILADVYPRFSTSSSLRPWTDKITRKSDWKSARNYLIIFSLFSDRVSCKDPEKIRQAYIRKGFAELDKNLSEHVAQWEKILQRIKQEGFFSISFAPEEIPEITERNKLLKQKKISGVV